MFLDKLVPLEDHQQEVVVLDVLESSPCVYMHLFGGREIKRKRETAAFPDFFNFVVEVSVCIVEFPSMPRARHTHMNAHDRVRGAGGPIFFFLPVLTFCLAYNQP
jgi:hypothetical protein